MAWVQMLALLGKAGPAAAKTLPKLWPLLLEQKNRERVMAAAADLASQSPTRRLRGRIDLTATLADEIASHPETSESDKAIARAWAKRARNLTLRLEMPVAGRRQKATHRRSIRGQLEELQAEMNVLLSENGSTPTSESDSSGDGNGPSRQ